MAGGGNLAAVVNQSRLCDQIKSCRKECSTIDANVDHLQYNYREYIGLKKLPFTSIARETLDSLDYSHPKKKRSRKSSPSSSKKREPEQSEAEDTDCSRRKHKRVDDSFSCSSSSSSKDGAVSKDEIHGKKTKTQVDLMKSMLRPSYTESKKSELKQSKSMELEVVGTKEGNGGALKLKSGLNGEERGPKFRDLGGMERVVKELKNKVLVPFYHPNVSQYMGIIQPVRGILLHGPPGCGKTTLARAIANETGVPLHEISATELVSGVLGASEANIRDLFSKAYKTAPSIIFIDEIEIIASKRENLHKEMEKRMVAQLMTCMDGFHKPTISANPSSQQKDNSDNSEVKPGHILVIGATNRPDEIDPGLRRPGRFDREILLDVPDEKARTDIISTLTKNLSFEGSFDCLKLARATPGFVGTDLTALINEAFNIAIERVSDQRECELIMDLVDEAHVEDLWKRPWLGKDLEKLTITMTDFENAIKIVQPSLKREGFSTIPNVKWEDVGGLEQLKAEFDFDLVWPLKDPKDYKAFGMDLDNTGFLLYGPPGCGKTLIAKAVANEAGINFIHIKGPELLSKYVGESELAVRRLFNRARSCAPCILFFDEVDCLTTKRGTEGRSAVDQLLNQLLVELDGAEERRGVFVIGATNRPEVMDPALLRPGRFDKRFYVPLPSPKERGLILKAHGRKRPIDVGVDLLAIGQMEACENFSGADLAALMKAASRVALEEWRSVGNHLDSEEACIKMVHFERGLAKVKPSVSKEQQQYYEYLSEKFNSA